MKLEYSIKHEFGKVRYYALNDLAKGVLKCCKQNSLTKWQIDTLRVCGFQVEVKDANAS